MLERHGEPSLPDARPLPACRYLRLQNSFGVLRTVYPRLAGACSPKSMIVSSGGGTGGRPGTSVGTWRVSGRALQQNHSVLMGQTYERAAMHAVEQYTPMLHHTSHPPGRHAQGRRCPANCKRCQPSWRCLQCNAGYRKAAGGVLVSAWCCGWCLEWSGG